MEASLEEEDKSLRAFEDQEASACAQATRLSKLQFLADHTGLSQAVVKSRLAQDEVGVDFSAQALRCLAQNSEISENLEALEALTQQLGFDDADSLLSNIPWNDLKEAIEALRTRPWEDLCADIVKHTSLAKSIVETKLNNYGTLPDRRTVLVDLAQVHFTPEVLQKYPLMQQNAIEHAVCTVQWQTARSLLQQSPVHGASLPPTHTRLFRSFSLSPSSPSLSLPLSLSSSSTAMTTTSFYITNMSSACIVSPLAHLYPPLPAPSSSLSPPVQC